MTIFLASDHRGFSLKADLKLYLEKDHKLVDCGNAVYDESDDFVDYVHVVAKSMAGDDLGIVVCGSGCGVAISANRYTHLRACVGWSIEQVRSDCHDDHVNVLALAADFTTTQDALELVRTFIDSPRSKETRYMRRIQKLSSPPALEHTTGEC